MLAGKYLAMDVMTTDMCPPPPNHQLYSNVPKESNLHEIDTEFKITIIIMVSVFKEYKGGESENLDALTDDLLTSLRDARGIMWLKIISSLSFQERAVAAEVISLGSTSFSLQCHTVRHYCRKLYLS